MRARWVTGCAVAAVGIALCIPGTASASGGHKPTTPTLSEPIATGLAGPLQLSVTKSAVYVAQSFAFDPESGSPGVLTKITQQGQETIATNPDGEIAGVAADDSRQAVVYTTGSRTPEPENKATASDLHLIWKGQSSVVADLLQYENDNNPDAGATYGFESISPECAAQLPPDLGPPSYQGGLDTHAYAVAAGKQVVYIADAGANAILAIGPDGAIRTVAVLPPQPTVVTEGAATALGLPDCAIGLTYDFEPVPTDVEIGPDGRLYVTTLPGGPEDPSLGARGSVYRINPRTGAFKQLATGFLGAANLAVTPKGDVYVSELFGNKVSKIVKGKPVPVVELPSPAGLEYANGKLYVGYDVFGPGGAVSTISIGR